MNSAEVNGWTLQLECSDKFLAASNQRPKEGGWLGGLHAVSPTPELDRRIETVCDALMLRAFINVVSWFIITYLNLARVIWSINHYLRSNRAGNVLSLKKSSHNNEGLRNVEMN